MVHKIQLTKGYESLVDAVDYSRVSKIKWYATEKRGKVYANVKNKKLTTSLHRFILGVTNTKVQVDHINGNTLDNRRENLRITNNSNNLANRGTNKNNTTGYKGVFLIKRKYNLKNKYKASIMKNNKNVHLGYFKTKIEAAKAYDKKALQLFGKYAKLNFKETK